METTPSHQRSMQEHLNGVPNDIATHLGARILTLSHTTLLTETRDSDFGSTYDSIPTEAHTLEQTVNHDKIRDLIGEVSRFVADAHRMTRQRCQGAKFEDKIIFSGAKELALEEAVAAHKRGETEIAKERFQTIFAISMIERGDGASTCDAQVRSAVAKGMGEEVVLAAKELHGVVALNDRSRPVSAPQVCEGTRALLQVATQQTFNDQFQHVEAVLPNEPSHIHAEILEKTMGELDARDLTALSRLKGEVCDDIEAAAMLAEKAGYVLAKEEDFRNITAQEVKDVIRQVVHCKNEVNNDVIRTRLTVSLDAVRAARKAGNERGRNNIPFVYVIDAAMIELAADGDREAVTALISSTQNEVLTPEMNAQDPNAQNLAFAFGRIDKAYTDEDKTRAHSLLLDCHRQKKEALKSRLAQNGASESTIVEIIDHTQDPDSSANVSNEFWSVYNQGGVSAGLVSAIQGDSSRDIYRTAEDALVLYRAGMGTKDIDRMELARMSTLPLEQRIDYERSLTETAAALRQWQIDNPDAQIPQTVLRDLAKYNNPLPLLQAWLQLKLGEVEKLFDIATILRTDKADDSWIFTEIDPSKLKQLQQGIEGGLPELLQELPQVHWFNALQTVCKVDKGYDSFIQLKDVMADGLIEIGGESNNIVVGHILRASDLKAEFASIKELEMQGLFEIGGEANNSVAVSYVLDATDKQKAVLMLKELSLKGLFDLTDPRNGLGVMGERVLMMCLQSNEPTQMLDRVRSVVLGGQKSLWWLNTQYADLLLGEVQNGAKSEYMVSKVPIALPIAPRAELDDSDSITLKSFVEMSAEEKQMWIDPAALAQDAGLLLSAEVPFSSLLPETRSALLAYRLFESIALSRSAELIHRTNELNKTYAERRAPFEFGDLVHATPSIQNLRNILISGILCGETIGGKSQKDSYPYNVDTVVVSRQVVEAGEFSKQVGALKNGGYGSICIIMHRTPGSTDFGRETKGGNEDHRLVFGAVPSTEINALVLRSADPILRNEVIDSVVEHGMYVPVYDDTGMLLLTYEDYTTLREDGNYEVARPEVVDGTFKLDDTQGGSNEGAWYVMPTSDGRERWYVKYGDASPQKAKHLWTEILADRIYVAVTPQLVSETKAIIVDGRLARASKEVALNAGSPITETARNEGFVMDCLLGNWDAVYNSANLVMSTTGHAMRIDTGNSFDFRARGEPKDVELFGVVVTEAQFGGDDNSLGGGMRQKYPGLTKEDIIKQIRDLETRLPPEKIDALVDSIRRPKVERDHLKEILKARRQYLIDEFLV